MLFPRASGLPESWFERGRDCAGDFILHGENVAQLAIESLRPEMKSIGCLDELRGNPDAGARFSDASFQNVSTPSS